MWERRSISSLQSGRQAAQKFDYFLAGLVGALLAYLVQSYKINTEIIFCSACDVVAMVLLIFAFVVALKRIESTVECSRLHHSVVLNGEMAAAITTAMINNEGKGVSSEGGEHIKPGNFESKWREYRGQREDAKSKLTEESVVAERRGRIRNGLLIAGFVIIIFSKGIVWLDDSKIVEMPGFLKSGSVPPRAIPVTEPQFGNSPTFPARPATSPTKKTRSDITK